MMVFTRRFKGHELVSGSGSFDKETIVALGNALVLGYRLKIVGHWTTSMTEAGRANWRRHREKDPGYARQEYSWIIQQRDLSEAFLKL